MASVQVLQYTPSMFVEPPKEAWAHAREKRERRRDSKEADDLALIEWYEALQVILLDPATGRPRRGEYGFRARVAKELEVDYNLLRYVERVDTASMRAELAERISARRNPA